MKTILIFGTPVENGWYQSKVFSYQIAVCDTKKWPKRKKIADIQVSAICDFRGGGEEIRTLAGFDPTAGFQDQSLQPLGYASMVVHRWLEHRTWRL